MQAPVSLYVFNRPDAAASLLSVLRQVKPVTLIVHADGPRAHVAKDADRCREVRALIETIDWDCEVIKNYSEENMGSFRRITSGFRFVFERFDRTIVLEDDCIPDPSFFPFCDELLNRYENDARVSMIGGFSNLHRPEYPYSYFFSRYTMSWGWAMWRRTWNLVDLEMTAWSESGQRALEAMIPERWIRNEWLRIYEAIHNKKMKNGWDYQLQLCGWMNNMLAIIPRVNLIRNVGFGADATHTQNASSANATLPSSSLELPIRHPRAMFRDVDADRQIERIHFDRNVPRIIVRQQVEAITRWYRKS